MSDEKLKTPKDSAIKDGESTEETFGGAKLKIREEDFDEPMFRPEDQERRRRRIVGIYARGSGFVDEKPLRKK